MARSAASVPSCAQAMRISARTAAAPDLPMSSMRNHQACDRAGLSGLSIAFHAQVLPLYLP